ncbi:Hypothetical predicted protein, partial [Paramuricea clavata]
FNHSSTSKNPEPTGNRFIDCSRLANPNLVSQINANVDQLFTVDTPTRKVASSPLQPSEDTSTSQNNVAVGMLFVRRCLKDEGIPESVSKYIHKSWRTCKSSIALTSVNGRFSVIPEGLIQFHLLSKVPY